LQIVCNPKKAGGGSPIQALRWLEWEDQIPRPSSTKPNPSLRRYNPNMSEPVLITTPIPTPEETADRLGVPRSRIKWLRSLLIAQGSLPAPKKKSRSAKSAAPVTKQRGGAKSRNGKTAG